MSAFIKATGTVHFISAVVKGVSKVGNEWSRQDVVIESQMARKDGTTWPDFLCITAGSNKAEKMANISVGQKVEVTYTVSAREYNGRWYNNVDLVDIVPLQPAPQPQPVAQYTAPSYQPSPFDTVAHPEDLPF